MSQSADVSIYRAEYNSAFVRRINNQRKLQRLEEEKRRLAEARAEQRRAYRREWMRRKRAE